MRSESSLIKDRNDASKKFINAFLATTVLLANRIPSYTNARKLGDSSSSVLLGVTEKLSNDAWWNPVPR